MALIGDGGIYAKDYLQSQVAPTFNKEGHEPARPDPDFSWVENLLKLPFISVIEIYHPWDGATVECFILDCKLAPAFPLLDADRKAATEMFATMRKLRTDKEPEEQERA